LVVVFEAGQAGERVKESTDVEQNHNMLKGDACVHVHMSTKQDRGRHR
jgi:hypothetical protein